MKYWSKDDMTNILSSGHLLYRSSTKLQNKEYDMNCELLEKVNVFNKSVELKIKYAESFCNEKNVSEILQDFFHNEYQAILECNNVVVSVVKEEEEYFPNKKI